MATDMTTDTIRISAFVPAPPDRIYAADFAVINKKLPEWDEWYKKEIQAR